MKLPAPRKRIRKPKPPRGYDSMLEFSLHTKELRGCKHHPDKIKYKIEHTYEPDFVYHYKNCTLLIEVKGRFRTSTEAAKYNWVAKGLPKHYELVFLFQNPNLAMPFAKKRKDGTKQTHAEWATKNNFRYFCRDTVPTEWGLKK